MMDFKIIILQVREISAKRLRQTGLRVPKFLNYADSGRVEVLQ